MIEMENPATLATCGAPNSDLADWIGSETSKSLQAFQARRCAISLTLAAIIAPRLHGKTVQ